MRHLVRMVAETVRAARASAWAPLVVRAALVACALVLLAGIGKAAGSASAPVPAPPAEEEAGAFTSAIASPLDAAPPASPVLSLSGADAGAPAERVASPARARASPDDPVDLNHASAEDLRRLPGCGEKRAEAILALRKRLGRFSRVEELLRVKGVGRATLKKWRPLVRVSVYDAGAP